MSRFLQLECPILRLTTGAHICQAGGPVTEERHKIRTTAVVYHPQLFITHVTRMHIDEVNLNQMQRQPMYILCCGGSCLGALMHSLLDTMML